MDYAFELHRFFGFDAFRAGQREACEAALEDRDVLVVMPTGSGKSLCYQLPGLLREDLTIVVSPLVALMQDQVDALRARGLRDQVALVNAQQSSEQNARALDRALEGELKLLYVAPERFSSPGFAERMRAARVGLFVVDEAHCVSQWGHDFRPDYFRLADAARYVGARAVIASTATATPQVATDIVRRLRLRDPLRVATGFDRPNLSFAVAHPGGHEKRTMLVEALRGEDALPAIVYAGTRAGSEDLAELLSGELGEEALAYHAGLDRQTRAAVQRRFLADEARIVVATNAFGMGVDKANVRSVVHASVPSSLEAYYQEAGRGGRDGEPARAVLLAERRDKALHVHFIRQEEVPERRPLEVVQELVRVAGEDGRYGVDVADLRRAIGASPDQLRALVGHLARAEVIEPAPAAPDRMVGRLLAPFDARAAGRCRASIADAANARWRQYREIWAFVEGGTCRRRAILRHFGDHADPRPEGPCCDVCAPALSPVAPVPEGGAPEDLDDAILAVARSARPTVGRTLCAEILHGAQTKKIARNSYDGLPPYGTFSHMRRGDILARVDRLIDAGQLSTTPGPYPVLSAPAVAA